MAVSGPFSTSVSLNFDLKRYNNIFSKSSRKISSGSRMSTGGTPGDLQTVEQMSSIVKKSEESVRVLQNGMSILQTSEGWLGNISKIVDAMGRVAISAADETKNDTDRTLLSHEFHELKQELAQMTTDSGKFNDIQTTGRISVSTWDAKEEKIIYSQPDGSNLQPLDLDLSKNATDSNGNRYNFVHVADGTVGDYIFSKDGKKLVYTDEPPVTFNITQVGGTVSPGASVITANQPFLSNSKNDNNSEYHLYVDSIGIVPEDAMKIGNTAIARTGGKASHRAFGYLGDLTYSQENPTVLVDHLQNEFDSLGLSNIKVSTTGSSSNRKLVLTSTDGTNIDLSHSDPTIYPGTINVPGTTNKPALTAILGFAITPPAGANPAEGDLTLVQNLSVGNIVEVMGNRIEIIQGGLTAGANQANLGDTAEQTAINLATAISSLRSIASATVTPTGSTTIHIVQETSHSNQELTAGVIQSLSVIDLDSKIVEKINLDSLEENASDGKLRAAKYTLDNEGNIWVSNPSPGSGYRIEKLHLNTMELERGGAGADNTFAGGLYKAGFFNRFSVYKDNAYYFDTSSNIVRRNLYDVNDSEILHESGKPSLNLFAEDVVPTNPKNPTLLATPMYDISYGGKYFAWKSVSGLDTFLKVMDIRTKETSSLRLEDSSLSITGLEFDENNNIYWSTTGNTEQDNAIFTARIKEGPQPEIMNIQEIKNSQTGTLGGSELASLYNGNGFNVDGGSPGGNFKFQSGAEKGEYISVSVTNPTLTRLGIIDTDVRSFEEASESISSLQEALVVLGHQQATLGAESNRISFAINKVSSYGDQQANSLHLMKDINLPQETAILTKAQMSANQTMQILGKIPQLKEMAIQLLLGNLR